VRMTIPAGAKARRVSTFLKTPFRQKQTGHELEIRLPRVEAYQAIVVELE